MRMSATELAFVLLATGMMTEALSAGQSPAVQPVVAAGTAATNALGPKIQFVTPTYDFGRVKSGVAVKYDFIFTNAGETLLEVTEVRPGCGCTTAGAWSRQVESGKTGSIP